MLFEGRYKTQDYFLFFFSFIFCSIIYLFEKRKGAYSCLPSKDSLNYSLSLLKGWFHLQSYYNVSSLNPTTFKVSFKDTLKVVQKWKLFFHLCVLLQWQNYFVLWSGTSGDRRAVKQTHIFHMLVARGAMVIRIIP